MLSQQLRGHGAPRNNASTGGALPERSAAVSSCLTLQEFALETALQNIDATPQQLLKVPGWYDATVSPTLLARVGRTAWGLLATTNRSTSTAIEQMPRPPVDTFPAHDDRHAQNYHIEQLADRVQALNEQALMDAASEDVEALQCFCAARAALLTYAQAWLADCAQAGANWLHDAMRPRHLPLNSLDAQRMLRTLPGKVPLNLDESPFDVGRFNRRNRLALEPFRQQLIGDDVIFDPSRNHLLPQPGEAKHDYFRRGLTATSRQAQLATATLRLGRVRDSMRILLRALHGVPDSAWRQVLQDRAEQTLAQLSEYKQDAQVELQWETQRVPMLLQQFSAVATARTLGQPDCQAEADLMMAVLEPHRS